MTMVQPLAGLQTEFKFVLPRGYVDDVAASSSVTTPSMTSQGADEDSVY